ncbi:hypothetical protein LXM94_20850 [Rhizobium sp. TRM95111]|uniref:glycosyltransferase n=1 Tax=Rhizobium alarense TaxID=2846851 RepID=UPI001F4647AD|nr:glycosyltransferase [Rhizobium alarense]MCF3642423.1 hypothetical protein [Rhizobium alarense]
MALRKIVGGRPAVPSDTTLAFAFDSSYLAPFGAMIRSMVRLETLLDCPVAIYSDDARVFNHPLVKLIADERRLLDGDLLATLQRAARDTVRRPERATWNRGTFLKWAVFEPQPTRQLLFLDVDMLCRAPLEPLIAEAPDAAFVSAPQVQTILFEDETGGTRPPADVAARLQRLLDGDLWGPHAHRVNSGVMLVRAPLLRTEFRDALLAFAFRGGLQFNEQTHMSAYFGAHPGLLHMVGIKYNFQANYLRHVAEDRRQSLVSQAAILHFAGKSKPWKVAAPEPHHLEWFRA